MDNIEYLKKYYKGNLEDAIKRLENGEPVQYIVGNQDFYGYILKVDKRVLIPRRETEELVEEVIKRANNFNDLKIVDIGTGTGAIAISLSKELNTKVIATDISLDAIKVARENIKENNANVEILHGNMLEPLINNNVKVNILVSNPPYIKKDERIEKIVYDNEPHLALFANEEGIEFYRKILENCNKILEEKFLIAFEIGQTQGDVVRDLAYNNLKNIKVEIKKDLSGKDRMVFVYNY